MVRKLLAACAFLGLAGTAHAGDKPLYAPVPAWVVAAPAIDAAKLTDSDPMFTVFDQQQRIDGATVHAYTETAVRLNSPQMMAQIGTIQLPWDPVKGDIIIHKLEILRGAERIDLIAAGQKFSVLRREQQLEQASLNGLLTATLAVEGLRVGDVLRLQATVTRTDPALHGNFQAIAPLLPEPAPVGYGRIRVVWPKDRAVQWRGYTKHADPVLADLPGNWREISVKVPGLKPDEMPDDAPMRFRPLPLFEATSYADWKTISKDFAPLYTPTGLIAPNGPIAAEVAKIAVATSDPRVRAAMALRVVQDEVRYLYNGMDNGEYTPQKPELTWSLRYGDCKAKTMLLLAMLQALGVEAEAVLAHLGMGDMVPARLASPGAFNHVLVRAVIGGKDLWLDGTGSGARLADLDDTPPVRWVLPIRAGGADLVAVPMRPAARPDIEAVVDVDSSAGVLIPSPFKVKITMRGAVAEMQRMVSSQAGKEASDRMIDSTIANYVSDAQIVDRTLTYDKEAGTAVIAASGISGSEWAKKGGRYELEPDLILSGLTFTPDRSRAAWRDLPVAAGETGTWHVIRRIRLPDQGKGFTLEGNEPLPAMLASAAVRRTASIDKDVLTIDQWMAGGLREIAVADIPAVRTQVALARGRPLKVKTSTSYPPLWREVEAARLSKAFDPMIAVYTKKIAAEPDKAQSYLSRATFLETIFDYPGVIRDLDKAIALDPSIDNYLWRARVLRNTGDDKRAIADLTAAHGIDPGATNVIVELATLRARHGETDAALAMVAEQISLGSKDRNDLIELQATLLGDAGRVDEGVAALDAAITASPGNPSLLNSRCWLKGTRNVQLDTALRDCTKAIELSDNPEHALDSRGLVYFRMGRLDDALDDLNAALEAAPSQSASLFLRGVVKAKKGDAAGAKADLEAARAIEPQVDAEYAKWGVKAG